MQGTPLPPLILQNLENKRFISPLGAKSLSLQDLYAKSREHGSYGGRERIFSSHSGTEKCSPLGMGLEAILAWVKLSKTEYYLSGNVPCIRLSALGHAVNDKAWFGLRFLGTVPGECFRAA